MSESRRSFMQYVCDVPPELGKVTAFKIVAGKMTVETESGIPMIVTPLSRRKNTIVWADTGDLTKW